MFLTVLAYKICFSFHYFVFIQDLIDGYKLEENVSAFSLN